MWLKICGISLETDIEFCQSAGVDCVGLLVKDSKNKSNLDLLTINQAKKLALFAKNKISTCLLTYETDLEKLIELVETIKPDILQIQSNVSPDTLFRISRKLTNIQIAKTFQVKDSSTIKLSNEIKPYIDANSINYILIDSSSAKGRGGNGKIHDWRVSEVMRQEFNSTRLILAGGLSSENLTQAIEEVKPFGVDIMTGASLSRGIKDHSKILDITKVICNLSC